MTREGPPLETLLRRLAETPADFLAVPRTSTAGSVNVAAVVADTLRDLGAPVPADLAAFAATGARGEQNRLGIVLVLCWLLHEPSLAALPDTAARALTVLDGAREIAPHVQAAKLVSDPDRREELARHALGKLGLRPAGESDEQSLDRLATISSAARAKVVSAARAAEERARKIREEIARKRAAAEADAKAMRE